MLRSRADTIETALFMKRLVNAQQADQYVGRAINGVGTCSLGIDGSREQDRRAPSRVSQKYLGSSSGQKLALAEEWGRKPEYRNHL